MDNETKYGNWIPFKKPLKGRHSFDGLTITKFKKIGLPQDFCLKNNIEKYQYAVFYFDGTIPAIGIEFTTIKQPGCALISWYKQTDAASLSCADFFRAFDLDAVELAGRYPYTVSQTEEGRPLYVINLADRV
jgi:hypothetical protein